MQVLLNHAICFLCLNERGKDGCKSKKSYRWSSFQVREFFLHSYTTLDWMYIFAFRCPTGTGRRLHAVDLNWSHWPLRVLNQRIWFKVMELGLEVGRALWLGGHWELWKTVTRGQPNAWHLWSANHCPNFLASKAASFLSLFGGTLLEFDLAIQTWNNKICDWLPLFFLLKCSFDAHFSVNAH